jgi:hypothetical protein
MEITFVNVGAGKKNICLYPLKPTEKSRIRMKKKSFIILKNGGII